MKDLKFANGLLLFWPGSKNLGGKSSRGPISATLSTIQLILYTSKSRYFVMPFQVMWCQ